MAHNHTTLAEHNEKCQFIIWNLLQDFGTGGSRAVPASMVVSELDETANCDDLFKDKMKTVRQSYERYIESRRPGAMQRIRDDKPDEADERVAEKAVHHYDTWTQHQLQQSLSFKVSIMFGFR